MNPRERWNALFAGQPLDRPLCDYWATGEVTQRLLSELNCENERALWQKLSIDKLIHLGPRHPRAIEKDWHTPSLFSLWQVGTQAVDQVGGDRYHETVQSPLAHASSLADIEKFPWPLADEYDLSHLDEQYEYWSDYPKLCGASEPFYLYCRLRGMEQALEDLLTAPAIAECILEHIYTIDSALFRRILEHARGRIDFVYVAEDLGTQESLLFSPNVFRKFFKQRMTSLVELAHGYGVKAFHHDDGAIRPLMNDLLDTGVDLINPVQWRCKGMDRGGLARDFGSRVVFHGAVDNQETLPFGTAEDVRREVRENLRIFSAGKGYIVAPCHNIQATTPSENILALYEAVHENIS